MKKVLRIITLLGCAVLGLSGLTSTHVMSTTNDSKSLTPEDKDLFGRLISLGGYKLEDINNLVSRSKAEKPAHLDIISKTNTALRSYAQHLKDAQSASETLTTLLHDLGNNLYTIANEQSASSEPLFKQKNTFLKLLDSGLVVQLILYNRFPAWQKQFDEQSTQIINEFLSQAKDLINKGLLLLTKMYINTGKTPFERAKLMISAVLIAPVGLISENAPADKIKKNIANVQTAKDKSMLDTWNAHIGLNYPELQEIFARE